MTYSGINLNMFSNGSNMLNPTLDFTGLNATNYNIGSLLGGGMFTTCTGEVDYNKMAGYKAGMTLGQFIMLGLHSWRSEKASSRAAEEEATEDLSDSLKEVNTKINTNLEKMGLTSAEEVATAKVDDYSSYKTATSKISELTTQKNEITTDKNKYKATMGELKTKLGEKFYNPTTEEEKALKQQYVEAEKQFELKEKEETNLTTQIQAEEKNQAEAKEKFEKLQKETLELLDEKNSIIKKQQAAKAAAQQAKDNQTLDDADKNRLYRLGDKKYDALFKEDGTLDENADVSTRAARTAVNRFMNAKTDAEKLKAGKQFQAIAQKLSSDDIKDAHLGDVQKLINKYVEEHSKKEEE